MPKQEPMPKWVQDLLGGLSQNPGAAGLVASLCAIVAGAALLLDDAKDFGKDGTERDPPMPHHWIYGTLILIGGVAGACSSGWALLKKLPKPKGVERLPPSLLEGAPAEVIEKFK
jgi:hypothetical protein